MYKRQTLGADSMSSYCEPKMICSLNGDWLIAAITFCQVFNYKLISKGLKMCRQSSWDLNGIYFI